MKSVLKKIKSDNKGNTLAIVLIGMFIVGVLGTVIIEASQVNLGMKVSNFKNKQNFYYVERAIDEIYAGIGQDVSKAMEDAYNASIKNVISKNSGIYSKTPNLSFENSFKSAIDANYSTANAIKRIKYHLGIVDPGDAPNLAQPEEFYNDVGVSISVSVPAAGWTVKWEKRKKDPSDPASPKIEILVIKDVLVKSKSNTNKYEASVKTDFEIEVPDIEFKFDDDPGNGLNSDFFEYALIADGKISDRKDAGAPDFNIHGAVNITGGSNVEVNGNIYAGDYHGDKPMGGGVNQRIDKDGIYVSDSTLTVNAANIVSKGAVRLEGSKTTVTFNGEAASSEKIGDLPLKLWTNDILLSGNEAKADINGNCFIKDDLEVNGNECSIDISGSYYGFGFESESGGLLDTSNDVVNEKRSGETPSLDSVASSIQREHEKRSAVIVNGDGADVKLATDESSNRQFILGGRAYIDLTGKTGADSNSADYMTGESIALKGNQKIYLVDNPDPNGAIKSNPASIQELVNNSGLQKPFDSLTFYDYLKVNKNEVVAKRVGNGSDNDLIYFYHNTSDPIDQTDYAWKQINSPLNNGFDIINEAIGNMNIKNLYLGNSTVSYTAGTAIQIKDHNLITGNDTPYGENGIDAKDFKAIINNVGNRYKNIMYNLNDGSGADNSDSKMEEGSIPDKTGGSSNSPYDHFVDDGLLNTLTSPQIAGQFKLKPEGITNQESDFPISKESVSAIKEAEFPDGIPKNQEIIIVFGNNRKQGQTINIDGSSSKSYGVIVCTGDVKIDRDFEGMIICGGNITITDNHKFKKNPELMKMLYKHSSFLRRVLKCESVTEVTPPTSGAFVKRDEGFAFDSFVHIKNWRKNGED